MMKSQSMVESMKNSTEVKQRERKTIFVFILLISLVMSSCSLIMINPADNSSQSKEGSIASSLASSAANTPRAIVDQAGRTVEVPEKVERIVTTLMPLTNLVFAAGAADLLVAADDGVPGSEFLQRIAPEVATMATVGAKRSTNVEAIAAVKPDLVFMHQASGNEAAYENLLKLQIPTVVLIPETREQMLEALEMIGIVTGSNEQAAKVISEFQRIEELVAARIEKIPSEQRKRVMMTGSELLTTQTGSMYQQHLITAAGGINVAEKLQGSTQVISPEQIIEWQPDFIFTLVATKESPAEILENPHLSIVNAIMQKNVYRIPSKQGAWDYPEPRSACAIVWMAQLMYPDLFADLDLLQLINDYHTLLYGKSYTELGGDTAELLGQ